MAVDPLAGVFPLEAAQIIAIHQKQMQVDRIMVLQKNQYILMHLIQMIQTAT